MGRPVSVAAEIRGLTSETTLNSLRALAATGCDTIVEIGTYRGRSAIAMAEAAAAAHVWTIDPWDLTGNPDGRHGYADRNARREFDANVERAGVGDRITHIQAFSTDVARDWPTFTWSPIDLLYIDGDHSEAAVRADFEAWRPHLAPEAWVVFDDLDTPKNPGVRRAIEALGIELDAVYPDALGVVKIP